MLVSETASDRGEEVSSCPEIEESRCEDGDGVLSGLAMRKPPRDCERLKSPSMA